MSEDIILAVLTRLEAGQIEMRAELTAMRADVTSLEAGQTAMRTELAAMRAELTAMRADLTRLEAVQNAIRAEQHATRADLTSLESGQNAMRADLTGLRGEVTSLRDELMSRMDRLQNTLTSVEADISVNMGAADAAQRVNENTREDLRSLREQVSVMWRQLKAVQARVRELSGDA